MNLTDPTHIYFRKLEREAKLANQLADQTDRGNLVKAVRRGIPQSYAQIITNIGFRIPRMYPQWKQRILQMYDECQKQRVFEQTQGIKHRQDRRPPPLNQKQLTATSSKPTGGTTSSSMNKAPANDKGHDSAGRWMTPTGADAQMQIDTRKQKQRNEGRCFRCDKKGHLSKDCPDKQPRQEVRAIDAVTKEPTTAKIEEVKE